MVAKVRVYSIILATHACTLFPIPVQDVESRVHSSCLTPDQRRHMDFDARLRKAIERGEKVRDLRSQEAQARVLSEEELRNLHAGFRIELSDHIEQCLKKIVEHFPGFDFQTVVSEEGWGARIRRDDLQMSGGRSNSLYSRLEMLVTPFSPTAGILELSVKGTVRNREAMSRKHFYRLTEVDLDLFRELIDQRALEFAELYSATT